MPHDEEDAPPNLHFSEQGLPRELHVPDGVVVTSGAE